MYNVHKTGTAYDIYNLTALDFFYQKPNKTTDNLKKYNYICKDKRVMSSWKLKISM